MTNLNLLILLKKCFWVFFVLYNLDGAVERRQETMERVREDRAKGWSRAAAFSFAAKHPRLFFNCTVTLS